MIIGLPSEGEAEPAPEGLPYQLIGTPEHLMLNLQDRLDLMISLASAQLAQKRPKKPKPAARPITMAELIQAEMDDEWAEDFYRELGYADNE